jgi:uncharacterized protein
MDKLFVFLMFLLAPTISNCQKQFTGLWEGKMNVGVEMRIVFKISLDQSNKLFASFDIPDQGLKEVKASSVEIVNDSLKIEISQFKASYAGKLENDSLINGRFHQQMSLPLQLKKVQHITEILRPQTPVQPFPYKSEDIIYKNADHSISYGATITIPNGKGPFPAVLLLTGSGQQNRDEELAGHKPFAVIADHLTKNGFIVLRADDRGIGQTTGDVESATSYDFAQDASVGINYLLSRKEVDKKKIGFIGHSEGGVIAQLVASERSDIHFIVSLAGPGANVPVLMSEQNRAIFGKAGLAKEYIDKYISFYDSMIQIIVQHEKEKFETVLSQKLNQWMDTTSANIVLVTTGIKDENSKKDFIQALSSVANSNWFRYFIRYNPYEKVKGFRGHYLALNGDKDIQVLSTINLQALESALKTGKAKSYEIHELKGLNHLFQECKICNTQEYLQIDQTISPAVLELITFWLKKIVAAK